MFKKEIKYYITIIIAFYLLPALLLKDTGSAMFVLLILVPLVVLVNSIIYGINHEVKYYYFLIVAILFIPSIYLMYNESAWIYHFIWWSSLSWQFYRYAHQKNIMQS